MAFRQESTKETNPPWERLRLRSPVLITEEEELELQEYFNQGQGINLYEEEIRPLEELELLAEAEEMQELGDRFGRAYDGKSASSGQSCERDFYKNQLTSAQFRTPSPKHSRNKSVNHKIRGQFKENLVRVSGISNVSSEEVSDWNDDSCELEDQDFNR